MNRRGLLKAAGAAVAVAITPAFLTDTKLKILRGQFRNGRQLYEVIDDIVYRSAILGGDLTIPRGYVTDLASVPKAPLMWWMAGGTGNEAAVVHDWLYTAHTFNGKKISRATADAVLREAITASEDKQAPGWLMWLAVRIAGGGSWKEPGPIQPDPVAAVIGAQEALGRAGA